MKMINIRKIIFEVHRFIVTTIYYMLRPKQQYMLLIKHAGLFYVYSNLSYHHDENGEVKELLKSSYEATKHLLIFLDYATILGKTESDVLELFALYLNIDFDADILKTKYNRT